MNFKISYDSQPLKFLNKQEIKVSKRIISKINILIDNPVPHNSKRIEGIEIPVFRIRVGDYRILYRINYKTDYLIILKIDKRGKVYNEN